MFDELKSLAIFAVVVKRGSFAAAARELGLTRAAVSHQIRALEARHGIALANRSTRSLSLTHAGEQLARYCQRMLSEAQDGLRVLELLRDEPQGRVRVTCSHHFGQRRVLPALIAFRRRYPAVTLDVMMTDTNVDLIKEGVDLAVRAGPLPDSGLLARKLIEEPTMLCAAPSYLARAGSPTHIEQLAQHQWVIYPMKLRTVSLESRGERFELSITGGVRTDSASARYELVLAGEGIARLPAYDALDAIAAGELVPILPQYKTAPLQIYLVHSEHIGPMARLLTDFMLEYIPSAQHPYGLDP